MPTTYRISATVAEDHKFYFRAGFGWPANGIEVQHDPDAMADDPGKTITTETLTRLKADKRISVTNVSDEMESSGLRDKTERLTSELSIAQGELKASRATVGAVSARCADLEKQLSEALARISGLETIANQKTEAAAAAQALAGTLKATVDAMSSKPKLGRPVGSKNRTVDVIDSSDSQDD